MIDPPGSALASGGGASAAGRALSPPAAPAVVELLLRPGRFFRDRPKGLGTAAALIAMAVLGIAGAIDRLDVEQLRGRGRDVSWANYWAKVLAGLVLGGPVRYFVGGWWYRMRLALSGARGVPPARARAMFALSELVRGVPLLLVTIAGTIRAANPLAAMSLAAWPTVWGLFLVGWSIFVSYEGATTAFSIDGRRPLVWFVILPALFLGGVVGYGFAVGANLL